MKLLLDTSAYVRFKLGSPKVVDYLTRADLILISPVVLAELMYGFRNGSRYEENMEALNEFLSHEAVETIQIGATTADRYARIAAQLKCQGTPIPTNDIWLAAQTIEYGAELVTADRHFEKISGLVYHLFTTSK
ncbi:MAG: type II toxin-antitoxin system VapC family toxin [Desulfoferrobacter sp.]